MAEEKALTIDSTNKVVSGVNDTDNLLVGLGIKSNSGTLSLQPFADSTAAVLVKNAAGGTTVAAFDTTNSRLRVGDGTAPTARLDIVGGGGSVAPLHMASGALVGISDGNMEYDGSHLYFSIGAARYQLDQQSGGGSLTKYDTVANCRAAAAPTVGDICWIEETRTLYQFLVTGGWTDDGKLLVANTALGGANRWFALAGQYGRTGLVREVTSSAGSHTIAIGYDCLGSNPNDKYGCDNSVYIGENVGSSLLTTDGSYMVVIGANALTTATGTDQSVIIGANAAAGITSGYGTQCVYIGYNVAQTRTQGQNNIAIGAFSMEVGNTSDQSVCVGTYTGRYATGDYNVFIGNYCGNGDAAGSSGGYNAVVGYQALAGYTTSGLNVVMGYGAAQYHQTGGSNVILGSSASGHNTQTTLVRNCVIIGDNACNAAGIPAQYTIAIGSSAMSGSTGAACIGIGVNAGDGLGADSNSTYIGYQSGANNAGAYCVALGSQSGNNSGGDNTVLVGYRAGQVTGSNTVAIGYESAYQSDATTISCTFLGYQAGRGARGTGSTYIGYQAGYQADTGGDYNIGIGWQALYGSGLFSSATYNTAIGYQALYTAYQGDFNVMIGFTAGVALTNGTNNVGVGPQTLSRIVEGSTNIGIGAASGTNVVSGGQNIAIGYNAMYSSGVTCNVDNLIAIGYNTLKSNTTGTNNIAIGAYAGESVSANAQNTYLGYTAGRYPTGAQNVGVGFTACGGLTGSAGTAAGNVGVGAGALASVSTATYNTAIGVGAGAVNGTFAYNVFAGYLSGNDSSGSYNTFLGSYTGVDSTGDYNVALGYYAYANAGATDKTGAGNIAIGREAIGADAATSGGYNVCIGYQAGYDLTTDNYQTYVGHQAGANSNFNCSGNVGVGFHALYSAQGLGTGGCGANTAVGYQALEDLSITTIDTQAIRNTAVGYQAGLNLSFTASYNTALGALALGSGAVTSNGNTAVGYASMYTATTTAAGNTSCGYTALYSMSTGDDNIALGNAAGYAITTGSRCIAIGYQALGGSAGVTQNNNTAIGYQALYALTSGYNNDVIGYQAANVLTTGFRNVCIGQYAGQSITSADYNIAIGYNALTGAGSLTGPGNIAIGANSLIAATADSRYNVAIGYNAAQSVSTGDWNISIGVNSNNASTQQSCIAIGEAAVTATLGAVDKIQLGTGTNALGSGTMQVGQSGGPTIACYAQSWNPYSDRRHKKEIATLAEKDGLALINSVRPVQYKWKNPSNEHQGRLMFGLIAQEIKDLMNGLGYEPHGVYTDNDENGWALDYNQFVAPLIKSVQQLSKMVEDLQAEVALLKLNGV